MAAFNVEEAEKDYEKAEKCKHEVSLITHECHTCGYQEATCDKCDWPVCREFPNEEWELC